MFDDNATFLLIWIKKSIYIYIEFVDKHNIRDGWVIFFVIVRIIHLIRKFSLFHANARVRIDRLI